ncbi:MAG TPA: PsbP-related protein [Planctomycetota bacterium]|nr:PsbP-related protein [Planctomycetota bacterium]
MRKVAVARCAFVVLTLAMLAASGADKTVTNKEQGFEITFPYTWRMQLKRNKDLGAFGELGEDRSQAMLFVMSMEKGAIATLKDHVNAVYVEGGALNYKITEKVEQTLAGVAAFKITYERDTVEYKSARGKFVDYALIANDRVYTIVAQAPKDDYDKYAKDIDAIVKSFKLIEAK